MMLDRWVINKLGLINFWYYDEEEFHLSDGKLLLRGANGSGKSVTMQSFIPLLLDGNKRPERLDPFGTTARKIENYLLVNEGETERTAYLYMEFKKGDSDRYITIGMGLKAVKGKPVDSWYFIITDNRRIKTDLNLYHDKGVEKTPLTKKELGNRLTGSGFFTDSQTKYKEKVNEYLFGYRDIESYDELINLLINIRTPKLSKDFKPTAMYEILENSLRQLTEEDLRPMSEAMENMDNIKLSIEQLESSMKSAKQIEGYYSRYNTFILQEKANNYVKRHGIIKDLQYNKDILRQEIKDLSANVEKNKDEKDKLNLELSNAQTKLEQFKDSDILRTKDNLEKLKEEIAQLQKDKQSRNKSLDNKKEKLRGKEIELDGIEKKISYQGYELDKLMNEMEGLALEFDFKQHDIFSEDMNFDFAKGALGKHKGRISSAKELLFRLGNLKNDHEQYMAKRDKSLNKLEDIQKNLSESQEYFTTVKEEFIEKIVKWNRDNKELKLVEKNLQDINRSVTGIEGMDGVLNFREHITEVYNNYRGENISKLQIVQTNLDNIGEEINLKKLELKNLEQAKEVEYHRTDEVKKNRVLLRERGIPFIPLYKAMDFQEDMTDESKKAIESALVDLGIVDALIIPNKYKNQVLNADTLGSDKYIFSEPNIMVHNLTQFLKVDSTALAEIAFDDVDDVLSSIFLDRVSDNFLDDKGNYGLGLLKGKATKEYQLKFIGAASRKEHRMRLIDEIKTEISNLQGKQELEEIKIRDFKQKLDLLSKEYSLIPKVDDLRKIVEIISDFLSSLNIEEKQLASFEQQLIEVTDKIKVLRGQLFAIADGFDLENTYSAYLEAEEAATQYGEALSGLEILTERISNNKDLLAANQDAKLELELTIDQIIYEMNTQNKALRDKETQGRAMEETLERSGYASIKDEMDNCYGIVRHHPSRINSLDTQIGVLGERITNRSANLSEQDSLINSNNKVLIQLKGIVLQEYKLGYVEEVREITDVKKLCSDILKLHSLPSTKGREEFDGELNEAYNKNYGILRDYQPKLTTIFTEKTDTSYDDESMELEKTKVRKDIHFRVNGKEVNFFKLIENLKQSIEDNRLLLSDREREFFQDILLKTLSNKIKAKIYQSQKWVRDMNTLMQSMNTSSSFKLTLKWAPKKAEDEGQLDTKRLVELLQKEDGLIREEDMLELSKHFSSKVKEIVRSYEDKKENRNYFTVIKEILDYRKWYEFKLYSQKEGEGSKELTNNAFFQLSGGEKAMGMYIPLFTAVYSRFDIADKKDCPRIVCLDEAFAGVDEGNIRDMFRILREMNLDYILNSQVLWGDYDTVDSLAISEILRPDNADFVTVINYQWNGKEKICLV